MLRFLDNLNDLLYRASTVSMPAKSHWICIHSLDYLGKLIIVAALSNFLCEVVAKRVIHDLHESVNRVIENKRIHLCIILFYLFLQEAATSLVLCQKI
jgi:hypothetical protein